MTTPHRGPTFLVSLLAHTSGDDGWIGGWSPGIGDPNFAGWLTVVAYLVAAWLCLRVFRRLAPPRGGAAPPPAVVFAAVVLRPRRLARLPPRARERALWLALAVVLFLLGVNKQLDLQTALTEVGRMLARSQGWYEVRGRVQLVFIACVALGGAWLFHIVWRLAAGSNHQMRSVLAGTVLLICFVTIRAASFHHIDYLLGTHIAGFKLNWILELGGIAFVIHGAWGTLRAAPRSLAAR